MFLMSVVCLYSAKEKMGIEVHSHCFSLLYTAISGSK